MKKKKSFATLIKLQKSLVDEQRQVLCRLQDRLDSIDAAIAQLEILKAREQEAASQEVVFRSTYGEFLKTAVLRGRVLEKERLLAARAVELAHDKLAEMFEDQKRYETAEAQRLAEEAQEEMRLERIALDEIGSIMHERKREG